MNPPVICFPALLRGQGASLLLQENLLEQVEGGPILPPFENCAPGSDRASRRADTRCAQIRDVSAAPLYRCYQKRA